VIRDTESVANIPIIAMTANAFDADREACLAAGMNAHIAKPVDPKVLYETLYEWLPERDDPGHAPRRIPSDSDANYSQCIAALSAIEGLNVTNGLKAANGHADLYVRLLSRFIQSEETTALASAYGRGEADAIIHAAHTIKGVAATVGADRLHDLALAIEIAVKSGSIAASDDLIGGITDLGQEFGRLSAMIDQVLQKDAPPSPTANPVEVSPEHMREIVARLDELLSVDDMEAITLFRNNLGAFQSALGPTSQQLGKYIEDFAFSEALDVLRAYRDQCVPTP